MFDTDILQLMVLLTAGAFVADYLITHDRS